MIPEQIWDKAETPKNIDKQFVPELKFGEGTGSATPLAWSMAQFIRLAVNLQEGKNLDTPDVVYNRYVLGKKLEVSNQKTVGNDDEITEIPLSFKVGVKDIDKFFGNADTKKQNPIFIGCANSFVVTCIDSNKEMHACFYYEGDFKTLEIAGDFTGWKPQKPNIKQTEKDKNPMSCLTFAKTARVEYKLIVDGKWINDPLNPNKVDNGVGGENSVLTMPDYEPTKWLEYQPSASEKFFLPSKVEERELSSKIFGSNRMKVYLPGGYDSPYKLQHPVLYVMDGTDYIQRAKATLIQETLVDARQIKPFIIVFLDPKDRMKDYWANDDYAKFVATEVVPAIDKQYNTVKSRDGRAILGASLGGITSFHAAMKYPEIFGRVGGQSSSFWVDNERVVKELEKLDVSKNKFKFYIDDGTLEGVEDSRKVVEILKDKGFTVSYVEAEAGHNWTAWRDRLADAFIALWK